MHIIEQYYHADGDFISVLAKCVFLLNYLNSLGSNPPLPPGGLVLLRCGGLLSMIIP